MRRLVVVLISTSVLAAICAVPATSSEGVQLEAVIGPVPPAEQPVADVPYCVPSVEEQFDALKHHPEALGFHVGSTPDPTMFRHYQGIQRLAEPGNPVFFVSRNNNPYEGVGNPAGPGSIAVVEFSSTWSIGERVRSNRLQSGSTTPETAPPIGDRGIDYISFDGTEWPAFAHVGGMQLLDGILAIALEAEYPLPLSGYPGMIVLADVSDPENPIKLQETYVPHGAGAVALGRSLEPDGRWLGGYRMIVMKDGLHVYESNRRDLRSDELGWVKRDAWHWSELVGGHWYTGSTAHQSINLIEQCDGKVFLIGTRGTPGVAEDYASLYELSFTASDDLRVEFVSEQHVYCNSESGLSCNFTAAAAPYVSPSGELILYATEHEDDGGNGGWVRMAEFRHEDTFRPGSPAREPTVDARGPYEVTEGGVIMLSGHARPPESAAWVELFEDANYEEYSLMVDWPDRDRLDLADFDEIDHGIEWGIPIPFFPAIQGGFGDEVSSVRWELPVGCTAWLYADQDFQGDRYGLGGTGRVMGIRNLESVGLDDKTHSLLFEGTCRSTMLSLGWDTGAVGPPHLPGTVAWLNVEGIDGPTQLAASFGFTWAGTDWSDTAVVHVTNVNPSLSFIPQATVSEGVELEVEVGVVDPGGDHVEVIVDWGDGASDTFGGLPDSFPMMARHTYVDDDPSDTSQDQFAINVAALDDDTGATYSTHTIMVQNADPTVEIESVRDPLGVEIVSEVWPARLGQTVTLVARFTDSGAADTHSTQVDWGDGTVETVASLEDAVTAAHRFSQAGRYTIRVVVVDDDGGVGTAERSVDAVGVSDAVGLVDSSAGKWHLRQPNGIVSGFFFGVPGDVPVTGDWDCDGVDTPGLYRQSTGLAYLRNSNTTGVADISFIFGIPGDIPIVGDFNGDGCDTLGVYRKSRVFIINELGADGGSLGEAEFDYWFGVPGDVPFTGDFDGDGVDELGLFRESSGFVYFSLDHPASGVAATASEFFYGIPGDKILAGDWTGDGVDTVGVFRPTDDPPMWYLSHENRLKEADEVIVFGRSGWIPIGGRWAH